MCLGGLQEAEMRKTVDTLLDRQRGCMEALDKSGISALHLACTTNNTELVRSFIDGDPKPQQRHCGTAGLSWETTEQPARIPWVSKGMSALLFAACSGAVSVVKLLCEDYALDPDEICDANSRTALHHACACGHAEVLCSLRASLCDSCPALDCRVAYPASGVRLAS
jgi:ankyrin repeat protein